jgi:hypothetical protein
MTPIFKSRLSHLSLASLLLVAVCSSLVGCNEDPWFPPTTPTPVTCSPARLTLSCDTGTGGLGGEVDVTILPATNPTGIQSIGANASTDAVCTAMMSAASQAHTPYQSMSLTSVRFCGNVSVTVCGATISCLPASSCTPISGGAPQCANWPQLHVEKQTQDKR